MDGINISLTDFVDYSVASGPSQLVKVRELKHRPEYEPKYDYWKILRELLIDLEGGHLSMADVESRVKSVSQGKRKNYGEALAGFKKFAKTRPGQPAVRPRPRDWKHAGLTVRVNPELCYLQEPGSLSVKMYFKSEPATGHRAQTTLLLMSETHPRHSPALLDVRSGRLLLPDSSKANLDIYLRAQATAFVEMWNAIY